MIMVRLMVMIMREEVVWGNPPNAISLILLCPRPPHPKSIKRHWGVQTDLGRIIIED